MGYEIPVSKDARQLETMWRECVDGARTKADLARWLRDTTRWDFFLAVFGECHRGGHIFWREPPPVDHAHVPSGALLEVYRAVDTGVGRVLDGVDLATTAVVVFSLHGMGHNFSQEHFVRRAMDRINATYHHEELARERPPAPRRGLMRTLRESIPAPVQHAVARSVPVQVRDWVVGARSHRRRRLAEDAGHRSALGSLQLRSLQSRAGASATASSSRAATSTAATSTT